MLKISILAVITLELLCSIYAVPLSNETSSGLNIVIIGAGPSGLVSAKYAIEQGFNVTVYEQGEELGGTWVYTDNVGKDKYGNHIHSSMYKNLRAQIPMEIMVFKDHHYPGYINTSYPGSEDVLKYLQSYAERFDLKKHITFNHLVVRVHPIENGKWEVIVKDQPNNKFKTNIFDAVFVCNGHSSVPYRPTIEGADQFGGEMIHSHDFRSADRFSGEKVLVIGGGPSGLDIAKFMSKVTSEVTLSIKKPTNQTKEAQFKQNLAESVVLKYDVKRFTPNGAEFIDGSYQNFTKVIYATGYNYSYPFLSVDTGVSVDNDFVQPLYKQIFNVNHPTMAFIAAPKAVLSMPSYDLQVRFAMKFISGEKKLPSKIEMQSDEWAQSGNCWDGTIAERIINYRKYSKQLSEAADIENVPEIFLSMELDSYLDSLSNPFGYRNHKYTVLDDINFKKEHILANEAAQA